MSFKQYRLLKRHFSVTNLSKQPDKNSQCFTAVCNVPKERRKLEHVFVSPKKGSHMQVKLPALTLQVKMVEQNAEFVERRHHSNVTNVLWLMS